MLPPARASEDAPSTVAAADAAMPRIRASSNVVPSQAGAIRPKQERPERHRPRAEAATEPQPPERAPVKHRYPSRNAADPAAAPDRPHPTPHVAPAPASSVTPPDAQPRTPRVEEPATEKQLPDAATLFTTATAARRDGRRTESLQLFLDLRRRFPASREGQTAAVLVGRLRLELGHAPALALRDFNAYLAHGNGSLVPEALAGRATAFDALGRPADAARDWAELLRRFPKSALARRARARLEGGPR